MGRFSAAGFVDNPVERVGRFPDTTARRGATNRERQFGFGFWEHVGPDVHGEV